MVCGKVVSCLDFLIEFLTDRVFLLIIIIIIIIIRLEEQQAIYSGVPAGKIDGKEKENEKNGDRKLYINTIKKMVKKCMKHQYE